MNDAPAMTFPVLRDKTLLVCVGAAKCATSWLHGYLDSLEGAEVSPLKEVQFFNMKFPQNALGDMEGLALRRLRFHLEQPGDPGQNLRHWPNFQGSVDRAQMVYDDLAYFAHFARLCRPDTRVLCDTTPAYAAIGAEGFAFIRDFAATQGIRVKLLFVLRDPVDRFWSQLRQLEEMNPANNAIEKWPAALTSPPLMARADYRATIEAIETAFPSDALLTLFYEDIRAGRGLTELCDFIGLTARPPDLSPRNVTGVATPLPEAARTAIRAALAPQYDYVRQRFGALVPADWAS